MHEFKVKKKGSARTQTSPFPSLLTCMLFQIDRQLLYELVSDQGEVGPFLTWCAAWDISHFKVTDSGPEASQNFQIQTSSVSSTFVSPVGVSRRLIEF